jgi:hypothetical protein
LAAFAKVPRAFWSLPAFVAWHLFGALLAYATGQNDIAWWLETSGDRILSQVAPLALFSGAMAFAIALRSAPGKEQRGGAKPSNTKPPRQKQRQAR